MTPLYTARSPVARAAAWAWVAFTVLNLLDLGLGLTGKPARDATGAVMAALLLLGCGIAYVLGLRPAIVADEAGVTLRNPLRDVRAPWRSVRRVEGRDAVVVTFAQADGAERSVRAWVLQTSPRSAAKAEARTQREAAKLPKGAATALKGRTPTMFAIDQLNEIAERERPRSDEDATTGTVAWSPVAVASLAVPFVLLLVVVAVL
ncbi:PH domain-containing protein [Actinomadura logoneensis]|uniref:PH domain-containing protein n=1 Tax=Actinomadura logoneensis TaxID=2293572 RepID=A0A372JIZ7_9ACTN|nr:PH domain-containing protein [Actinomadura logoneensis]RFU39786.1 PH domain-containing protein [Actinomadura logoneensis]